MDLIWLKLHGYRRFEVASKINLEGKVVALIGPNEAGKSSVLTALNHLNAEGNLTTSGLRQETTRGYDLPKNQEIIRCGFLLTDEERAEVSHLPGGEKAKGFDVIKYSNGSIRYEVRPRPYRELEVRKKTVAVLSEVLLNKHFSEAVTTQPQFSSVEMQSLISSIDVSDESLSGNIIDKAQTLKNFLVSNAQAKVYDSSVNLSVVLQKFIDHEQSEHPHATAVNILFKLKPRFLFFSDEDRALESSHDLNKPVSTALSNLAKLANLDLDKLKQAISQGDVGKVEILIHRANDHLKDVFEKSWKQSNTYVRIRVDGHALHVLVGNVDTAFTSFAERSDGLRSFVALLAFVSAQGKFDQKPILLIDEAERHLHYEAQADLVQMLTKQNIVAKVIYSTHSAGCLPEDLGMGVRLMQPVSETRSEIKNWFWDSQVPGFSPLLFGMGATSLAFVPIRRALFTEGASDFILLPSLLRAVIDRQYLGFQVVPGLAEIGSDNLPLLRTESSHVAYLVDADEGGKRITAKLKRVGFPVDHILQLPDEKQLGLVLEDFVDPEVYRLAINKIIVSRYGENAEIPSGQIYDVNRPGQIRRLCEKQGWEPPSRREVAYRILEQINTSDIVYDKHRDGLKELYAKIVKVLNV